MSSSPAMMRKSVRMLVDHRWIRSLSANIVTAVAAAVVVMATTVFMARVLGPTRLGQVSFLVIVFNAVAALDGLRPVIVVRSSKSRMNDPVPVTALVIMTVIGVICAVLIAGAGMAFDFGYDLTTAIVIGLAAGLYFPISVLGGLLEAEGRTIFTGTVRNGGWMAAYAGFAVATWLLAPLLAYAGALLIFQLGMGAAYAAHLRQVRPGAFGRSGPEPGLMRELLQDAVNLVGFNLSALVLGTVDRLALGWVRGFGLMGPYASVYELATRPTAFMRVIAGVSLPELKMRQGDARTYRAWGTVLFCIFWITALAVALAAFLRRDLIALILGPRLLYTSNAFALIAVTLPISMIGYFCITLLSAEGDFRSPRRHYARGAVFMAIAAYPLIRWWGLEGAAMLFLLSRWIDLALLRHVLQRFGMWVVPHVAIAWCAAFTGLMAAAFADRAWLFLPVFCLAGALVVTHQRKLLRNLKGTGHG